MSEIDNSRRKAFYKNKLFYVYYELADTDGQRRILINEYKNLKDRNYATIYPDDEKYSKYFPIPMRFTDDLPSDESLRTFLDNYNVWRREAIFSTIYHIDFTLDAIRACQRTFFSLIKNYDKTQNIKAIEFGYFERCQNNALMHLSEDDIELECVSYDRKMCYGNILGSNMIVPICEGEEKTLRKLPKLSKVKTGFYRVKVTTDNTDFHKCFNVSSDNMYVDISLRFLLEFQEHFNLTLELIQDDLPNAYIYEQDSTIPLSKMTKKWLKVATELKKAYPKNPYIKFIASSTWGTLSQKNTVEYTADEINKKNIDVGLGYSHKYKLLKMVERKGVEYYQMVNTTKAYKFQLRLKPWVTAQARDDMGRLIMKHIDNVVRVQTDSLTFNTNIELNDPNYALESKTTGLIHWRNVNCYHNKTTGYKSKNY